MASRSNIVEVKRIKRQIKKRQEIWTSRMNEALSYAYVDDEHEDLYRLYQVKARPFQGQSNPNEPKQKIRRKNFRWIHQNNTHGLPIFASDLDSWMSFGIYHKRFKKRGFVAAVKSNFIFLSERILKKLQKEQEELAKTEAETAAERQITIETGAEKTRAMVAIHKYIYTCLTDLAKTVQERCKEKNLPQPEIIYTADGLQLIWHWENYMSKQYYLDDIFCYKFNDNWEIMQKKLFNIFKDLGADPRKLTPTAMYRIPGSINTSRSVKTKDRVVRVLAKGEVLDSFVDMQTRLKIFKTAKTELEEALAEEKRIWARFKYKNDENYRLANDWEKDILRIHKPTTNYVCLAYIFDGKIKQNWVRSYQLKSALVEIAKSKEFRAFDFYASQAEFPIRKRKNIYACSVSVNFLDLDFKEFKKYHPDVQNNLSPGEWLKLVQSHLEKINGCEPNLVMFTGGGIHVKWIYKTPINLSEPAELAKWQYLQHLLWLQFKTLGADPNSLDPARILRMAGSFNHKNAPHISDHDVRVIYAPTGLEGYSFPYVLEEWEKSTPQDEKEFRDLQEHWHSEIEEANKPSKDYPVIRNHLEHHIECLNETFQLEFADYVDKVNDMSILKIHKGERNSWIHVKFPDGCSEFIRTADLKESLKFLYPHEVYISAEEFCGQNLSSSNIKFLTCNYVILQNCPGKNTSEKIDNILSRCKRYRRGKTRVIGIPLPRQIIEANGKLYVEWIYNEALPHYAYPRWAVTQEYLAHLFEDYGAFDDPNVLNGTSHLPLIGCYYGNEQASLAFLADGIVAVEPTSYTFNTLANAVLPFSQKAVKEYKEQKEKKMQILAPLRVTSHKFDAYLNPTSFSIQARQRYHDLLKIMDMRKQGGQLPQGHRELFVYIATVSAVQAGLIKDTGDDFDDFIQNLIAHCGSVFQSECDVQSFSSLKRAFMEGDRVIYKLKTNTIITKLDITKEEQQHLVALKAVKKKRRESRESWLAKHTTERDKPWLALNISRATWYRRKAKGLLNTLNTEAA